MGLMLRNQDQRSEVQTRVAAQLQERLNSAQEIEHKEVDPAFLDNYHQTRSPGALIVILLMLLIVAIIWGATKL